MIMIIYDNAIGAVLIVSTYQGGKMSIFGLTDPWIWGAYASCFLTVVLCAVYWFKAGKDEGDEEDE